jgi:hypothetical protein
VPPDPLSKQRSHRIEAHAASLADLSSRTTIAGDEVKNTISTGHPRAAESLADRPRRGHLAAAAREATAAGKDRMEKQDRRQGLAADIDVPIPYMERIRGYYEGLGYGAPYRWAHYPEVPFQALAKPLAACRIALITTAAPYRPEAGDQGPGASYNAAAKFYTVYSGDSAVDHDLRISHLAYDRVHTTAEDANTWFPLPQLRRCAAAGRIGAVANRFHGAPTNRSQRITLETDCPELLVRCRADGADAAILVAN